MFCLHRHVLLSACIKPVKCAVINLCLTSIDFVSLYEVSIAV